ncbi:predicted protein [Sclerotinia sclerotiorum 1980 UF-70]|uniref:Uncharacterized protein n=1 Tax=Sclerotinia sclerotiorum (strain ATCC 18683 / 1980 / Ss-1) TaxID=665079 RepID=A7E9B1_SCLS1|nr:predicted protein [Sclerotinia sclerotiorum 1980 UF-70]EDN96963.1 predicted protein [Sclerotinia sclerotiorum 1980 UF-70]
MIRGIKEYFKAGYYCMREGISGWMLSDAFERIRFNNFDSSYKNMPTQYETPPLGEFES